MAQGHDIPGGGYHERPRLWPGLEEAWNLAQMLVSKRPSETQYEWHGGRAYPKRVPLGVPETEIQAALDNEGITSQRVRHLYVALIRRFDEVWR